MGVRRARLLLVLVMACAACTPSTPQTQPPPSSAIDGVIPSPYRSLVDAARERGSVRVIVTLAIPYRPEGELPQDAVQKQRAEIEAAQRRLLDELKPFKVELNRQYNRLPQLALTVDEAGMRHLATSPLVKSVQEDKADSTTS
ncbi:hypothetical protein [Allorhizocola rhizosphaerae]|uniref:hypothetical protein n=1 Tax=Allorhizocola rhizosphaerae TaxID=1872709 RepID=UPI0013C31AA7|nr:hypothetical protein [Allorhizocola rhizosphaerae]